MIVAKTNLKKIPDTCNKCKFSKHDKYFDIKQCTLLNKRCNKIRSNSGNWMYIRLKDCPLINLNNIS